MKSPDMPASEGAEQACQQLPAIIAATARTAMPASLLALSGSGRDLWGTGSRKNIARLRHEWQR
jgi:hypothetical protein